MKPPRWGAVRIPPSETWRNCTHVRLRWAHPADYGGTALAGYRLEIRDRATHANGVNPNTEPLSLGPAIDAGWNASAELLPPQTNGSEAEAYIGPLDMGIAYEVRVRAYSVGSGCAPVPGDDGAILVLHGGWRADRLEVDAGPAMGGPIHGGTVVRIHGACMDAVQACVWASAHDASSPSSHEVVDANANSTGVEQAAPAEIMCRSVGADGTGLAALTLRDTGGMERPTGLLFEYFSLRASALEPLAGPYNEANEVRIAVDLTGSLALRRAVRVTDAQCRFHGAVNGTVAAVHASSAEVACFVPHANYIGPSNVSVSLDAGHTFTTEPLVYLSYNASITQVMPLGGPVRGGTIATIVGSGLAGAGRDGDSSSVVVSWCAVRADCAANMHCRFGTLGGRVRVDSVNETHVVCESPPTAVIASGGAPRLAAAIDILEPSRIDAAYAWDDLRTVDDALTYSLNDWDYLSPRLNWTYYVPPTVSSLQPADGPASGGQSITVRGVGFKICPGRG